MTLLFNNYATSTLASGIASGDSSIAVTPGEGARFPAPGAGEAFLATLVNPSGNHEIVRCSARSGDTLTVARGQEGTVASSWEVGTRIEQRMTAGTAAALLQKVGGTMAGNLDMDNFEVIDARLATNVKVGRDADTATGLLQCRQIGHLTVGSALRIFPSTATNGRPRIGATYGTSYEIITNLELKGFIFMWSGAEVDIPAPFILCNGANGTPDLRERFILGKSTDFPIGPGGPSWAGSGAARNWDSEIAGDHNHGGNTADHVLTTDEIPSHTHVQNGTSNLSGSGYLTANGGSPADVNAQPTDATGGGDAHKHAISNTGSNHSHGLKGPPYYALCFVMVNPSL